MLGDQGSHLHFEQRELRGKMRAGQLWVKRGADEGVKRGNRKVISEPAAAEQKDGQRSMKAKGQKSMSQH